MAKLPSFAKAFAGRWRIVEMDIWDNDFLDLIEEAHLTFKGAADGEIAFGGRWESPSMSATAPATVPLAQSSRRKDMMRTTRPAAAAGLSSVPPVASSATSTSITPTIRSRLRTRLTSSTTC